MTRPFAPLAIAAVILAAASAPAFARDAGERRAPGSNNLDAGSVVAALAPTSVEIPNGRAGRNCDRRATVGR